MKGCEKKSPGPELGLDQRLSPGMGESITVIYILAWKMFRDWNHVLCESFGEVSKGKLSAETQAHLTYS